MTESRSKMAEELHKMVDSEQLAGDTDEIEKVVVMANDGRVFIVRSGIYPLTNRECSEESTK